MQVSTQSDHIRRITTAGVLIVIGLFLFKFIPMQIWGSAILFDASAHIAIALFVFYILWFFIDQNQTWRVPFFLFVFLVLAIISIQRILVFAHNDTGLLLGFLLGIGAIAISQWDRIGNRIHF